MLALSGILYLYAFVQLMKGFLGAMFGGIAGKVSGSYDVKGRKRKDMKAYAKCIAAFALATFLAFVFI